MAKTNRKRVYDRFERSKNKSFRKFLKEKKYKNKTHDKDEAEIIENLDFIENEE